ncbi:hypothetical protein Gocc_1209 [Gaiella occulta]|uniref:Uncharacterized protein n=1 Tax=Gaiella occulta TaxID=1002870 RepID=A0A7M2Z0S2_9ACTN|nr:hypothetical protein [Gaiella occulta]RDI75411.1 hypothetical protein Gocc_1209 [Gaiella occulta]
MSYRARRRLVVLAAATAAAGALVLTATFFWNTAGTRETFSGGPAQIFTAPAERTLTAGERAALVSVAQRFVSTAVARDHPERAFDVVTATLRGGLSRKQWASGEIPVVPYPVDGARWKVQYANEEAVGLLVLLYPAGGAREQPTVFTMRVVPRRLGDATRWLVDAWGPQGGPQPPAGRTSSSPADALAGIASGELERVSTQASTLWLAIPVALLGLVFVVPIVFLVRERRAERRMRRRLGARTP